MPPATDLVHALKYEGWREIADFMGRSMAQAARAPGSEAPKMEWDEFLADALVVPVATTAARARARGYNQAALLADVVASRLQRPSAPDALVRRIAGTSQTVLSPEERRENVRGAFVAGSRARLVRDRAVLLVDDVLTTGATACEAASALRDAGSAEVRLLTFGRALPGRDEGAQAAA